MLSMRADYLVNTARWSDPALEWEIDDEGTSAAVRAKDAFALGYAALQRGERSEAERQLRRIRAILDGMPATTTPARDVTAIMTKELGAALAFSDGMADDALSAMREATALEDALPLEFGPPDVVKPSHELLGEMLLSLGDPAAAGAAFQRALALAPRRAMSVAGLERSAREVEDERRGQSK